MNDLCLPSDNHYTTVTLLKYWHGRFILYAWTYTCLIIFCLQLVAIADYCVHQLLDTTNPSDPRRPLTSNDLVSGGVGWVYKTKVRMLCDAYTVYSAGLQEAQTLLSQLKGYTGFSSYLDKLNNPHLKMDISQFLNHPIKVHIYPTSYKP